VCIARFARIGVVWAFIIPAPLLGQTLPARPVPLEEPVRGGTWKDGELVLGRTTLSGARRILAGAAGAESPRRLPEDRAWEVGGITLRPRWQFDPGEDYFQLFFDDNERLIFALDRRARPTLTRLEFLSHYPRALRAQQSGSFDQYQVDVQPCVTLTALVDRAKDHITQYGYAWTCRTSTVAPVAGEPSPPGR
jgi:hypothetical protein